MNLSILMKIPFHAKLHALLPWLWSVSSTAQVRDYHNNEDDEYESHDTAGDNHGQTRGGLYPRCVLCGYERFHGLNLVLVKLLSCIT